MYQPVRVQSRHLGFPIGPKKTNLVEDDKSMCPVKFLRIPFSGCREEVKSVLANQRPWQPCKFFNRPEKHKLNKDVKISFPVKFHQTPFSGSRRIVENVSSNPRPGPTFYFSDHPKHTKLVKDVEILLPVKFRQIPFSGFIEVKMWEGIDDRRTTDDAW